MAVGGLFVVVVVVVVAAASVQVCAQSLDTAVQNSSPASCSTSLQAQHAGRQATVRPGDCPFGRLFGANRANLSVAARAAR